MMPLVSVVIPSVSSRRCYLENALESVRNQTYSNIEVITVVDDTVSAGEARNRGIRLANGDFIAFLDDDDVWHPQKIEKQIRVMLSHPDVALVTCYSEDKRYGFFIDKPSLVVSQKDILNSLCYSSTSAYLVRRYALGMVGGFDTSLPSAQEYELAIRLLRYHKAVCIPEVLVTQNRVDYQISTDWSKKIKGLLMVYRKHKNEFLKACFLNPVKVYLLCFVYLLARVFGAGVVLFVKKLVGVIR